MRQFSKCVLVTVLALSLGLHWALLQSIAWTGMVLQYTQTSTFKEALAKTFDGRHPCQLCKIVSAGKKSAEKQEAQQPVVKLDFFLTAAPVFVFPPALKYISTNDAGVALVRGEMPPIPPPRQLPG